MTESQWDKLPDLRKELEAEINDPRSALANALYIVERQAFTPLSKGMVPQVATSLTEFYSAVGARREGYLEALENLRALARVKAPAAPVGQSWDRNQPK